MNLINFKITRSPMLKPRNKVWGWLGTLKGLIWLKQRVKAVVLSGGYMRVFDGSIENFNELSVNGVYFIKKPMGFDMEEV